MRSHISLPCPMKAATKSRTGNRKPRLAELDGWIQKDLQKEVAERLPGLALLAPASCVGSKDRQALSDLAKKGGPSHRLGAPVAVALATRGFRRKRTQRCLACEARLDALSDLHGTPETYPYLSSGGFPPLQARLILYRQPCHASPRSRCRPAVPSPGRRSRRSRRKRR